MIDIIIIFKVFKKPSKAIDFAGQDHNKYVFGPGFPTVRSSKQLIIQMEIQS